MKRDMRIDIHLDTVPNTITIDVNGRAITATIVQNEDQSWSVMVGDFPAYSNLATWLDAFGSALTWAKGHAVRAARFPLEVIK